MSESMTYQSLLTDVQTYAERDDQPFVNQIPRFIALAENRIASEIRGLGAMSFVNSTFIAGNPVFQKPNRWRETISVTMTTPTGKKALLPRSYQYCRSFWPDEALQYEPRFIADYDFEHFFVSPTPDQAYAFELAYYERPEPLDLNNNTNWYTQYAPQLLLYATLLEAQPFLKLDSRMAQFQSMYDRVVQGLGNESMRRLSDANQARREA